MLSSSTCISRKCWRCVDVLVGEVVALRRRLIPELLEQRISTIIEHVFAERAMYCTRGVQRVFATLVVAVAVVVLVLVLVLALVPVIAVVVEEAAVLRHHELVGIGFLRAAGLDDPADL